MSIFKGIFGNDEELQRDTSDDDMKIYLREEKLDIAKNRVQKGDVEFGKEIIEERKIVDVPEAWVNRNGDPNVIDTDINED
ncbi:MAG TPA: DUF2382 domain-containing protein [Clostridiaceae bacterium]